MKRSQPSGDADVRGAKRQRQPGDRHVARPAAPAVEAEAPRGAEVALLSAQRETDAHRLAQRQKQIDYGKNTLGYDRYCAQVPRHKRRASDPATPDKTALVSKKQFDHMVRRWRQALHRYDPPELAQQQQADKAQERQQAEQEEAPPAKAEAAAAPAKDEASSRAGRSIFDNFDDNDGEEQAGGDEDEDDDLL